MTREEQLKYCQCCRNRKSTTSKGLVCSLTGEQASFEDGCKNFDEDRIATKEHFYSDEEKRNSRYASIETLIVGLAFYCFGIPYVISVVGFAIEGDYHLFGRMAFVTGTFVVLGAIMIALLYISRKHRNKSVVIELTEKEMFKTILEEGYFPHIESDGDITFKINGTTFSFGRCANGFVYGRLYYTIKKEDSWHSLLAAQDVELSIVAIKVMIHPNSETLLFSVESLCGDKESFRSFFNRALSILGESVGKFYDKMRELESDSDCCDASVNDQSKSSTSQTRKTVKS